MADGPQELRDQSADDEFKRNERGLRQRAEQIKGGMEASAMHYLVYNGEETAAKYLAMHEKLDKLGTYYRPTGLSGDATSFIDALYEAVATLCDGVTNSTQPDYEDSRQRMGTIGRKGPELAVEIAEAVKKVGGSLGPRTPIQLEERRITVKRTGPLK